jgi:hypothetical protein
MRIWEAQKHADPNGFECGSRTLGDTAPVPVVLDEDQVPYLDISGKTFIHTSCSLAAAVVVDLKKYELDGGDREI